MVELDRGFDSNIMSLLAVVYHYVRPDSPDVPGLRYLHLDDFRSQLDYLASVRRPVKRDEFIAAVKGHIPLPNGFILTFDDGLADHANFVLPELVNRGWWGSFYVPAGPWLQNRSLDVHTVHALLGRLGGQTVLTSLELVMKKFGLTNSRSFGNARYLNDDDNEATLMVKRLLNYDIEPRHRSMVIDSLIDNLDCRADPNEWYMSIGQMDKLIKAGMVIGSHTVTHRPMSQLTTEQQAEEIDLSFEWLESVVPTPIRSFCYPYGGNDTFNVTTEKLLADAGCLWSFNVDNQEITQAEVSQRPQALSRIDCCQLPFGKSR